MPGPFVGFVFEIVVLACCGAAVVTNSLLLASCEFFKLSVGRVPVGSLGLYFANFPPSTDLTDITGTCIRIDIVPNIEDVKDTAFNCARVCAVIAFIFGAILLVFGFFKQFLCPLPCTQLLMDICGGSIQFFLVLVYVIWASEACDVYQCTFGDGGTYLVLTQIFWMLAACFTRCMRPGRYERRQEAKQKKKGTAASAAPAAADEEA